MNESIWKEEKIYHDGARFFEDLLKEIDTAKETIDLEFYIYDDDELGKQVTEHLMKASQRGVRVKVMVDGIGSPSWHTQHEKKLREAKIQTRIYHLLPWNVYYLLKNYRLSKLIGWVLWLISVLNKRNHRKTVIIDHHSAWVGSFNVSSFHIGLTKNQPAWRDSGVRVVGKDVLILVKMFHSTWIQSTKNIRLYWPNPFRSLYLMHSLVRFNSTIKIRRYFTQDLIHRIQIAQKRIWITNAYFIPNIKLLKALNQAATRGVDVCLIIPQKSDVFFMPWMTSRFYQYLLKFGIKIYEYTPSILHAKILIIDDFAMLGSSNLNSRSTFHDLEVDVVLTHPDSIENLKNKFLSDRNQSKIVTEKFSLRGGFWGRIFSKIFFFIRHWI